LAAIGAGAAALLTAVVLVTVVVIGCQPGGGLSFQPSPLSFPKVPINKSVTRSLTMTNNGRSAVTVTRIRIAGRDRGDFAVGSRASLSGAHGSGQAIQPAAQRRPACLGRLPPAGICKIKVVFTPSAAGPRTADLRIRLASNPKPWDIALTGTGIPAPVTLTLTPPALRPGRAGTRYQQRITASGGTAPYTFSVSGSLPHGLTLNPNTGAISGTPTKPGSYQFTITATDSGQHTRSRRYTLRITQATVRLTLTPTALPNAIGPGDCPAQGYSQTITAAGGTAPYTFSVPSRSLPPGLTLTPVAGSSDAAAISGTPTTTGSYPFTITATDASATPNTRKQHYTINVDRCSIR